MNDNYGRDAGPPTPDDETRQLGAQASPQGYWQPPSYSEPAPMPDSLKVAPDAVKMIPYQQPAMQPVPLPLSQSYQPIAVATDRLSDLRAAAEQRVRQKEKFQRETMGGLSAIGINLIIWAAISIVAGGAIFFWPIFVIMGVGIGIFSNYMKVYGPQPMSETERERQIELEIQRMQGGYGSNQPPHR